MALNLCVPVYNKADLTSYLRKQLLKKKSVEKNKDNENIVEKNAKNLKRKKKITPTHDLDDSSSSEEISDESYLEKIEDIPIKKKRKVIEEQYEANAIPKRNTRETKLFRHF